MLTATMRSSKSFHYVETKRFQPHEECIIDIVTIHLDPSTPKTLATASPDHKIDIVANALLPMPAVPEWVMNINKPPAPLPEALPIVQTKKNYPIQKALLFLINLATTLPMVLNSMMYPSGQQPSAIGKIWWESMNGWKKLLTVLSGLATAIIHMIINDQYVPKSLKQLGKYATGYFTSCKTFSTRTLMIFLGLSAALVAGAIAYNSFGWAGTAASIFSAALNFIIYGGRRFVGLLDLIGKIKNRYDSDAIFQRACLAELKKLDSASQSELNALLQGQPLNEKTVAEFLHAVYNKAIQYERLHTSLFRAPTRWEKAVERIEAVYIVSTSAAVLSLLPTMAQIGYDGVNILTANAVSDWSPTGKLLLGAIPAIVNNVFYLVTSWDCFETITAMAQDLRQDPRTFLLRNLPLTTATALTCGGFYVVGDGAIQRDDLMGIFGLHPDSSGVKPYLWANIAGGFFTTLQNIEPVLLSSREKNVTVDSVVYWLERNALPKKTLQSLQQHSFFNKKSAPPLMELASKRLLAV